MSLEDHMVGAVSEAGVGHDESRGNEDYYKVDLDLGLVILADAAGGHGGADFAAKTVVEAVHEYLKKEIPRFENSGSIKNLLTCSYLFKQAIGDAHNTLLKKAEEECVDPLTTIEIAYLLKLEDETKIVWATVGDSKQYLVDENGITDAVDLSNNKNQTKGENWVGAASYNAFVFMTPIEEGQRWIMCSDGIVRKGIEDIMTDLTQNPKAHAKYIADEAKRRRSKDDRTVIVIDPFQLKVEDADTYDEITALMGGDDTEAASLPSEPDSRLYRKKGEDPVATPHNADAFYKFESSGPEQPDVTDPMFSIGSDIQEALDTPTEPPGLVASEEIDVSFSEEPEEPNVIIDMDADQPKPEEPKEQQAEQQGRKFPVLPAILVGITVAVSGLVAWYGLTRPDTKIVDHNVPGIVQPEYPVPAGVVEPPKPVPVPKPIKQPEPVGPDPEPTDLEKITEETQVAPTVEPVPELINSLYKVGERSVKASFVEGFKLYGLADSGKVKGIDNKIEHFEAASMYLGEAVSEGRFKCSTGRRVQCDALYFQARSHYQLAKLAAEGSEERQGHKRTALGLFEQYLSSNSRGVNEPQYAVLLKWGEKAVKDVNKVKALK